MNLDPHQKQFLKLIEGISHRHSNALRDFCELGAITFANALQIKDGQWHAREARYLEIIKQYDKPEAEVFPQLLGCIANSLSGEEDGFNFHDCLGDLHMTDEITGRSRWDSDVCFTPSSVGRMMAEMTFSGFTLPVKGYVTIGEPAAGAGGLIIQACAAFKAAGFNFQRQMHVTATEIRPMLAHMAFIQFSILHIPAVVIHGNTLSLETWSVWKTPAHVMGFWDYKLARDRAQESPDAQQKVPERGQTTFDFQIPTQEKRNGIRRKNAAVRTNRPAQAVGQIASQSSLIPGA